MGFLSTSCAQSTASPLNPSGTQPAHTAPLIRPHQTIRSQLIHTGVGPARVVSDADSSILKVD